DRGDITVPESVERIRQVHRAHEARMAEVQRQVWEQAEHVTRILNVVLPPGWLPLGAEGAARGNFVPALLGTLMLGLLGVASLARAYRTRLRLYRGEFDTGRKRAPAAVPAPRTGRPAALLERQLPWLSEQAAAVTLGALRSLTRAPEAKMVLLTPAILAI